MIPMDVLADPRLKPIDIRVYGFLASCRRGSLVTVGMRRTAKSIHTSSRRIAESLKRLSSVTGHLTFSPGKRGQRTAYTLTSPLFTKNTKNSEELAGKASDTRLKEESVKLVCPKCHTRCKGLLRVGWCRSCNWSLKMDSKIDRKLDERGVPRREVKFA